MQEEHELIDFSKAGLFEGKCKACKKKYNSEHRNKRKALSDAELREQKSAKTDISIFFKCSDCSVFTQGNYNCLYFLEKFLIYILYSFNRL